MPELLERETVEETIEITDEKEYTNEDLLNRQPFIDKVKTIIELQAAQKKTACFAINGAWGVGKTFVLKRLEEQLEEIVDEKTSNEKYMIFHYNCWQYDYYEEPLVAIVSSMMDTIDEKVNLIADGHKKDLLEKAKGLLKIVGSALLVKANDEIKEKTGVDIEKLAEFVSNTNDILSQGTDDIKTFDSNFLFKKTLIKLQQTLQILSKEKTIIFVVDELDRCLPEYAIKVLERLHHIFEEVSNVQVILSIDKGQLKHIVKSTFGEGTKTEKYLSKFIRFYMDLDEGSIEEELYNYRFSDYVNNFDYLIKNTVVHHVEEFKNKIFVGVDMRERIEIIEKCNLVHSLISKENEKHDFSVMCIEIFLMVLKKYHILERRQIIGYAMSDLFWLKDEFDVPCLNFLTKLYKNNEFEGSRIYYSVQDENIINMSNIYGAVLVCYGHLVKDDIYITYQNPYHKADITAYTKTFWDLLQIIN